MMREIVAAKIGNTITNRASDIRQAVESNRTDIQFLDRRHMQFMAACDLGNRWNQLASGPTFFCVDDDGNLVAPERK